MVEARIQQIEITVQMDDTACAADLGLPNMNDSRTGETPSSSGELAASYLTFLLRILAIFSCCSGDNKSLTVPSVAGNLTAEIGEFIVGLRRYGKNILGARTTSAIRSPDNKDDINKYIPWLEEQRGEQLAEDDKKWIKGWLPDWYMFIQARAEQTLVTRWNLFLTIVGFIFYLVDLVSDIGTSMYCSGNGQWWRTMVTLANVYGTLIIHTVLRWLNIAAVLQ